MAPVLFDSSIYVAALRQRDHALLSTRRMAEEAPVWLSAVVLEELYAGAREQDRGVVERLQYDFQKANRLLVPSLGDWVQTGILLSKLAAKWGYEHIGRGRLTNDSLIAMSTARSGFTLLTANARDFARIAEFRPFRWQVLVM